MLYCLLIFSGLLLKPNIINVAAAAAGDEFPRYLSFVEYKSILSFANDGAEESDIGISNALNIGNENGPSTVWDDFILDNGWSFVEKYYYQEDRTDTTTPPLYPFVICHIGTSSLCGRERHDVIDSMLSENNEEYFLEPVPIYNHNRRNLDEKKGEEKEDKNDFYGTCFYASVGYLVAKDLKESDILVTPVAPSLKIRKQHFLRTRDDENSIDDNTVAIAVVLSPGILLSRSNKLLEYAHDLQKMLDHDHDSTVLENCDKDVFKKASVSVSSTGMSSYFFYEFERSDIISGISYRCHRLLIEYLVSQPEVISIEKVAKNTLLNDYAQWIVQSSIENERPWFQAGVTGKGQIVQVADTGVDESNCYLKHDEYESKVMLTTDFDLTPLDKKIDHSKRKIIQYVSIDSCGNGDRSDASSHGTHVVASIAGKRFGDEENEYIGMADGIAPDSQISFFDGNDSDSDASLKDRKEISVTFDISQTFYFGLQAGAKIHSASWGSNSNGTYTLLSREVDEFFYSGTDDEFVMFVAAGNDGDDGSSTMSEIPTSKNVIAVGASHSFGKDLYGDMGGINYMASFSSRGPTQDGRIKPDLVAPGHSILSARAGSGGECDPETRPQFDQGNNANHAGLTFMYGTSMACPIAAGSGALVRQYFADGFYPTGVTKEENKMNITGTLLKAIMINGAEEMNARSKSLDGENGYDISSFYDEYQAFGRINLLNSMNHSDFDSPDLHVENERILKQNEHHEYEFNVCNDRDFRVTIVWKDPPGSDGCKKCLVNDLDLNLTLGDKLYFPNGKEDRPDDRNNVERIIVSKDDLDEDSTVFVKVNATDIGYGNITRYSLASTGCFKKDVDFITPTQSPTDFCEDSEYLFKYTLEIFTDRRPEDTSWSLEYQGYGGIVNAGIAGEYDKLLNSYIEEGCARYDCFLFFIRDTGFNGICCSKGMGSYKISAGDEILAEGYSFGDRQEIKEFCYTGGSTDEPTPSPTVTCSDDEFQYKIEITTDINPDETRWELRKAKVDGVQRGFYTEKNTKYMYSGSPIDYGCYEFIIHDDLDGLCCDAENGIDYNYEHDGRGKYKVMVEESGFYGPEFLEDLYGSQFFEDLYGPQFLEDLYRFDNTIIAAGSKFFERESHNFCYPKCDDCERKSLFKKIGHTLSKSKSVHKSRSPGITTSSYSTSTKSVSSSNMLTTCAENKLKYDIIIETDSSPEQISWEFSYLNGTLIASVEEGYYTEPNKEYPPYSICVTPGCFNYTIYDSGGDGIYTGNYFETIEAFLPSKYDIIHSVRGYEIRVGHYTIIKGGDIFEDYWYTETKLFCNFTEPIQPSKYKEEFSYQIILTTDNDPQNTWWELYPEQYIIDSVPFTTYTDRLTTYKHFGCAKKESCYELIIFDHVGDRSGLCCYFVSGSYSLSVGDEVLVKGNQFKDESFFLEFESAIYFETNKFCHNNIQIVSPPPSTSASSREIVCSNDQFEYTIEIRTDFFPLSLHWNFTYVNGTSIESVEKEEYTIAYYRFDHQGCALFDCFLFSISDDDGEGLCCSYGNGGYTVKTGDVILAEGGQFSNSETNQFCYGPNITTYPTPQETESPSHEPTYLLVCDENELKYDVIVTTDRFPQQTSWKLTYDDGTLIDSVEEGYYTEGSKQHKRSYCLNKGCFRYTIKDSGGDGICCGIDGNGKYEIKVGNQTLAGGGRFDDEDVREFCTSCEENEFKLDLYITTGYGPEYISWELTEQDGSSIDSVEYGHYTNQYTEYAYSYCLHVGCYRYTIKDSYISLLGDNGGYEIWVQGVFLGYGNLDRGEQTTPFCYSGEGETNSPNTEPVAVALDCVDASFFKYELTISTDYEPESTSWSFSYKYVDLNNIVSDPFSRTINDNLSGYDKPNTDYIEYGCAKRDSCFEFQMYRGYFKLRDLDSRAVIAQSTERFTQSSFCHYNPLERAIVTIIITVSTSPSDDDVDSMYTILTKSIQKILNQASAEIGLPYDDIIAKGLSTSCITAEHKCEVKFEVCNERCDVGGEVSLLSLVSQTLKQEIVQDGVFFHILKQTASYHDSVNIFENIESIEDIILGFDPDFCFGQRVNDFCSVQPVNVPEEVSTVSPTETPHITVPQQIGQEISSIGDTIMTFISGLLSQPIFGDNDDGLFHFRIEIIADKNPSDMSWELRYDNGVLIDSIGTVVDASAFLNPDKNPHTAANQLFHVTSFVPDWFKAFINATLNPDSNLYIQTYVQLYKLNHECFKFTIKDHYSDGICCNYGYGSYKIISGDEILAKGGKFKSQETKRFCSNSDIKIQPTELPNTYLSNCDSFNSFRLRVVIITYQNPYNIGWKLYDSNGDMIDSADKGDYTRDYAIYFHNYCLSDGCFYFEMCGGTWFDKFVSYQIYIDDSLVPLIQSRTYTDLFILGVPSSSATFCHPSTLLNGAESVPVCNQHEKFDLQIAFNNEREVQNYDGLSWSLRYKNGDIIDAVEVKNTKYIPYSNWVGTPVEIDGAFVHQNCVSEGYFTFTLEDDFVREKFFFSVTFLLSFFVCLLFPPSCPFMLLTVIAMPSYIFYSLNFGYYFVGSYTISAGDIILAEGNSLGYFRQVTKQFCYEPTSINKCEGNEFKFQLDVTTDAWPHEIHWNLAHEDGTIIKNAGKRYYTRKNTQHTETYCLHEGCYAFSIYDILGDGLCCSFGEGSYQININDGEIVMEGADFGYNERKEFCQETNDEEDSVFFLSDVIGGLFGDNGCCDDSPTIICDDHQFKYEIIVETDVAPRQTSWELTYDNGTVIDSVQCRQYTKSFNLYVHEGCVDLNHCFKYTIYDSIGDGFLGVGGYSVIANDVIVAEGGGDDNDWYGQSHMFCYPEENEAPFSDPTTSSFPTITSKPSSGPTITSKPSLPLPYEAEDPSNTLSSESEIKSNHEGFTGIGFVDMGGQGSWVEWPAIDGGNGGSCTLNFRYALSTYSYNPRPCQILVNDVDVGSVSFESVAESWSDYGVDSINIMCPEGLFKVRMTAISPNGGPNVDHLQVSPASPFPSTDPTTSSFPTITSKPSSGPTITSSPSSLTPYPQWPIDFYYSNNGPLDSDWNCVNVSVSNITITHNNFFCEKKDEKSHGFQWSENGPIDGKRCTQIYEPSMCHPHEDSYENTYLCIEQSSPLNLNWTRRGDPPETLSCLQWKEDLCGWHYNNFLCAEVYMIPLPYEAEDPSNTLSSDSEINNVHVGFTGTGYVEMNGEGAWIEWPAIDGGNGGSCTLNFRYALNINSHNPRPCQILVNDVNVGSVSFPGVAESWSDYGVDSIGIMCPAGSFKVRMTAISSNGGPNVDHLQVPPASPFPSLDPTTSSFPTSTFKPSIQYLE